MPWAERSIEIDAPPEAVWEVIVDFEAYPDFLSDMRAVRVESRGEASARVRFELDLIKRVRYTLAFAAEPPTRLAWSLVRGDFMRRNEGSWELEALEGGRTRATYRIALALGAIVPESITTRLAAERLPETLQAFKRRVEAKSS